ncbi:hypothetical protein AX018_103025 [Paracidovorax anthurii]|uniref:Uncharacterized protein n=1 Tax=Paracidovorax anthurii TaxID=78229 RepID=A0A328YYM8_9BURK|nr:hypothetical protein [Paracidovorax anthurii]RAR78524.1 hypothetical protein AX018_103025 [Paracidovorax anthurii]
MTPIDAHPSRPRRAWRLLALLAGAAIALALASCGGGGDSGSSSASGTAQPRLRCAP